MQRQYYPNKAALNGLGILNTPIWIFDVSLHKMWWGNSGAMKFWGADNLEDLVARDFSNDSRSVRQRLQRMVNTNLGSSIVRDAWTLYPKNKPTSVLASIQPVLIEDGRVAILFEISSTLDFQDDPDAQRMVEAARSAALLISVFDLSGRLLTENVASATCYGSRQQLDSESDLGSRFVYPQAAKTILAVAGADKDGDFESEFAVRTVNGLSAHRVMARRGQDPVTGEPLIVINEEDMTEQFALRQELQSLNDELENRIAERTERLRASEQRYQLAVQHAAIWDWSVKTKELYISPVFHENLGYKDNENLTIGGNNPVAGTLHPEDLDRFHRDLESNLAKPGTQFQNQYRFRAKSGDYRWFLARGQSIANTQGKAIRSTGLLTDITEQKELEAKLFSSQRLESIGKLTGGIAHDLNNILAIILGSLELMQARLASGEVSLEKELNTALEASIKGADLIGNMLLFARQATLRPTLVNLNSVVEELRGWAGRTLPATITTQTKLCKDLWSVEADAGSSENAVLNLLLNARDAMPKGGKLTIETANLQILEESLTGYNDELEPGPHVMLSVSDSGVGIASDLLDKVFEPFVTTKPVGGGTGLGLSMVHGFMKQSGGAAIVSSVLGVGTTVKLLFRANVSYGNQTEHKPETNKVLPTTKARILVVEDEVDLLSVTIELLARVGYEVVPATSGDEALAITQTDPPFDLLLSDIVLPGELQGTDLAAKMRHLWPSLPVLFVTGYSNDAAHSKLSAKQQKYLMKPVRQSDLIAAIESLLN